MAARAVLYEWLELWEQALEGGQPPDLDAFVQLHCQGAEEDLVTEFRRRAERLRWMNPLLDDLGTPAGTGHTPASTNSGAGARPRLEAGVEVVPGYPLERWLGSGGFGEVWQAGSLGGGSVALKFVPLGEGKAHIEQRALDLLRQLQHPHLLPVLWSGQAAGYLVIATELADCTLAQKLEQARAEGKSGIPRKELLRYFEEAAEALDYLNSPRQGPGGQDHGIQHRDIKPENLLLVGDKLKIGDFGVARCLEHSVTSHTGHHTLRYAAPEFFNAKATSQSDQYSLAVTWCLLRGGRLPFTGTEAEITRGHLYSPPDLSMLPPIEIYPVMRALAKEPKERWPSCREFVAALRSGFDAQAVRQVLLTNPGDEQVRQLYLKVRTPELRERDRKGVRVRSWVIPFFVALAVCCGVGGAIYQWHTRTDVSLLDWLSALFIGPAMATFLYVMIPWRSHRYQVAEADQKGTALPSDQESRPWVYWEDPGEPEPPKLPSGSG